MSWIADKFIANGIKGIIEDAQSDGKVAALVDAADKFIREFFPTDPKEIKRRIVRHLLFPGAKLLLKEDPEGYDMAKKAL